MPVGYSAVYLAYQWYDCVSNSICTVLPSYTNPTRMSLGLWAIVALSSVGRAFIKLVHFLHVLGLQVALLVGLRLRVRVRMRFSIIALRCGSEQQRRSRAGYM